jgi:DNA replication protein DnaC
MQRLGDSGGFEFAAEPVPCPTEGCKGQGSIVRLGARATPPMTCADCQRDADARGAEAESRLQVELLLDRAGGDALMRAWSWSTYPQDAQAAAARASAREWLASYDRGELRNLFITGPVGTGKTGLAWCIVRELCESGEAALLLNLRRWFDELKATFGTATERSPRPYEVAVLALDDVVEEPPSVWERKELASLLDRRRAALVPTIVTSNSTPAELARQLSPGEQLVVGQRIDSRLTEAAIVIELAGDDRRRASEPRRRRGVSRPAERAA